MALYLVTAVLSGYSLILLSERIMRRLFTILITSLLLYSCSIHGSFRGLYSYYHQTKKDCPGLAIQPLNSIAIQGQDSAVIYLINGIDLSRLLKKSDDAVVYIWKPNCIGQYCYSLNHIQELCTAKGLDLFVVAEYYDCTMMQLTYELERPLYGIDTPYYRSNRTSKYRGRFLKDIQPEMSLQGSFLKFRSGVFVSSFKDISDISQ